MTPPNGRLDHALDELAQPAVDDNLGLGRRLTRLSLDLLLRARHVLSAVLVNRLGQQRLDVLGAFVDVEELARAERVGERVAELAQVVVNLARHERCERALREVDVLVERLYVGQRLGDCTTQREGGMRGGGELTRQAETRAGRGLVRGSSARQVRARPRCQCRTHSQPRSRARRH